MANILKIKAFEVSVSLETDEMITFEEVHELLSKIAEAAERIGVPPTPVASSESIDSKISLKQSDGSAGTKIDLHVNAVAEALDAKTGPEVALAAAAYLQLVRGRDSFSRKELLDAMKEATSFYSKSMSGNLSKILKQLVGDEFTQHSNDNYALKSATIASLRPRLAQ